MTAKTLRDGSGQLYLNEGGGGILGTIFLWRVLYWNKQRQKFTLLFLNNLIWLSVTVSPSISINCTLKKMMCLEKKRNYNPLCGIFKSMYTFLFFLAAYNIFVYNQIDKILGLHKWPSCKILQQWYSRIVYPSLTDSFTDHFNLLLECLMYCFLDGIYKMIS